MNKTITAEETSAAYYERARKVMPGGISHRYRYRLPNPVYIQSALGAYKWDVEGRRYIDYKMGAASQMMGHCHPRIISAITEQVKNTPFVADCHPLEVVWAEMICGMLPSAERVRFTASGTEATMLAIRVARAYSGKSKVLRIDGHYHGWHDHVMKGAKAGSQAVPTLGVPEEISDLTLVVAPDSEQIEAILRNSDDIAAIIVEASGANYGAVPMRAEVLAETRRLSSKYGVVLIFDEIITGFRWAPGGRQQRDDVIPDLTTLAKIATGGMPGGVLAGKAEFMAMLDPGVGKAGFKPAVLHQGTFNGCQIEAAAAIAMLELLSDGSAQAHAERSATLLRDGITEIIHQRGIDAYVYGDSSVFHLYFGRCENHDIETVSSIEIRNPDSQLVSVLQNELNQRGVDLMSAMSGVTSAAHTDDDVEQTLEAFDETFKALIQKRVLIN